MTNLKEVLARKEAQAISMQQAIRALQDMQVRMESKELTGALGRPDKMDARVIHEAAVLMELTASTVMTAFADRMVIQELQEGLMRQEKEKRLVLLKAVALRVKTELTELTE